MRVALVCPYSFEAPGGVQHQVALLVRWLREEGHEAWAVAPGEGGPEGTRSVGSFRILRANRSLAPIAVDPRAARRVAEAVEGADVVHVHEPFMPMVSLGALMVDMPPRVGTFHADPSRLVRGAYRLGSPLVGLAAKRLRVVTAVSHVAASAIGTVGGIRIIPNGLDLARFVSEEARVPDRVLFVGRDEPRKGLDVLLQAWPMIRARAPGATLRVAGTDRHAGPEGVEFLGRLEEEDKLTELAQASLLVVPNLGGESFGIVVIEGMAAGCAVVASDLEAFRAVGGEAVRFTPAGDVPALADAVASVLDDAASRDRLSTRGRARSKMYGRDVVLPAYLKAYQDATDDQP